MHATKQQISAAILTALTISTSAAEAATPRKENNDEWVFVAENNDSTHIYSGKKGSFEITTTKSGIEVAMIVGQTENKRDETVIYNKWYVSTSDCEAGIGKLVVLKIDGSFSFESDYVSGGKNVASTIADTICQIYRVSLEDRQGKSI
jgi:hypothetical protein